jgi:hypothetical protein
MAIILINKYNWVLFSKVLQSNVMATKHAELARVSSGNS